MRLHWLETWDFDSSILPFEIWIKWFCKLCMLPCWNVGLFVELMFNVVILYSCMLWNVNLRNYDLVLETWVLVCIVLPNFGRWSWSWKLYTCTCISGFKWIKYSKLRQCHRETWWHGRANRHEQPVPFRCKACEWGLRPLPGPVPDRSGPRSTSPLLLGPRSRPVRSGPVLDRLHPYMYMHNV